MKKHWKAAAAAISGAVIMIGAVGFFALNQKVVDVQPSSVVTDLESTLNANDRVLLEVVPDASYAQLGYLEPGNEPINILKAAKDGKAADIQKVAGSGVEVKDIIDDVTYDKLVSVYNNFDSCWEPVTGASVKYRFKYQERDRSTCLRVFTSIPQRSESREKSPSRISP